MKIRAYVSICFIVSVFFQMIVPSSAYAIKIIFLGKASRICSSQKMKARLSTVIIRSCLSSGSHEGLSLGTRISNNCFLSCAHELKDFNQHSQGQIMDRGQVFDIEEVCVYPEYDGHIKANDFAIIKTKPKSDIEIIENVPTIRIFPSDAQCNFMISGIQHAPRVSLATGEAYQVNECIGSLNIPGLNQFFLENGMSGSIMTVSAPFFPEHFCDFVIQEGDSGGGLFEDNGNLVGVTTSTMSMPMTLPDERGNPIQTTMEFSFFAPITIAVLSWIQLIVFQQNKRL